MLHHSLAERLSWLFVLLCANITTAFVVKSAGYASLTHYDLPRNYVASCGCVGASTHYPTAAVNRLVYGSNTSFGPSCGSCFEIRLVSTPLAAPPPQSPSETWGDGIYFSANDVDSGKTPSLVVKVTDLCPGIGGPWCNATQLANGTTQGNSLGFDMHFDLAWPSQAISKSFFPGNHDYGVWNVSYQSVSCQNWAGFSDKAALGSDWDQQASACCPNNPSPSGNDPFCPPYLDTLGSNAAMTPNTSNVLSKGRSNTGIRLYVPPVFVSSAAAIVALSVTGLISSVTLL